MTSHNAPMLWSASKRKRIAAEKVHRVDNVPSIILSDVVGTERLKMHDKRIVKFVEARSKCDYRTKPGLDKAMRLTRLIHRMPSMFRVDVQGAIYWVSRSVLRDWRRAGIPWMPAHNGEGHDKRCKCWQRHRSIRLPLQPIALGDKMALHADRKHTVQTFATIAQHIAMSASVAGDMFAALVAERWAHFGNLSESVRSCLASTKQDIGQTRKGYVHLTNGDPTKVAELVLAAYASDLILREPTKVRAKGRLNIRNRIPAAPCQPAAKRVDEWHREDCDCTGCKGLATS